ncbi:hypothetical protein BDF21DRAFT_413441 [Thamnidium elegans]|uniref:Uncharacterized protein n=1 Tax=Thamnidium elegans TaxID=101142 RepID=A0A8H7SZ79_9FUNG|nr:hypothetical protein INT48_002691 [Thamnidium elegans]KAI8088531.1 hypothetical protein BDF21DRAFT_413441 [Thamnidium elegans]
MERGQAHHTPSTTPKKGRPKTFLSWIFRNNSVPVTDKPEEPDKTKLKNNNHLEIRDRHMLNTSFSSPTTSGSYMHNSTEATVSNYSSDIEIPDRRQSHLYTPFHDDMPDDYKRRSYYSAHLAPSDTNRSSSSLTRSATWQPSTTTNDHTVLLDADIIPDRRTSRNYAANPEIQARLNAMLNSDRTAYLSTVLQSNRGGPGNVHRRSTTPS